MAGRLEGKICVITGAGGGMGREAAIVFTGEGRRVCVADVVTQAGGGDSGAVPRWRGVRVRGRRRGRGRGGAMYGRDRASASAASTCSTTERGDLSR